MIALKYLPYGFVCRIWALVILAGTGLPAALSQAVLPSDPKATPQTIALNAYLKKLVSKGVMIGHQDDLAYGVQWRYEAGRSDIHDVTGDYPAVYGWEIGGIENDDPVNLDSVPFTAMKTFIREAYERGGIITISWHLHNPLTGKSAWEPAAETVASILPGGKKHAYFTTWIDKAADFLNSLRSKSGDLIPIIFRPFHELNGDWFWWGGKNCTATEFKQLWRFTINYLRSKKQLHHLLIAYNTDRFAGRDEYLQKYPGNEWVDIMGLDIYQRDNSQQQFLTDINKMLTTLDSVAQENDKLPALTEFGGNLTYTDWWTGTFLPVLLKHRLSYALAWRNAGRKANGEFEYYVPYKGEKTANDFKLFYEHPITLFQKDVNKEYLYK
jgi:Glycosyl hydrolase family 26